MPSKAQGLLSTLSVLAAHEADELDPHSPVPQLERRLCPREDVGYLYEELMVTDAWQGSWSWPVHSITPVPLRQGQLPKEGPDPMTGAKGLCDFSAGEADWI